MDLIIREPSISLGDWGDDKINVLSTFNGMGCIWLALDALGIKVGKRYASEVDKFANIVNDANYPDTIQLGDVTKVKAADLAKIDLLVGGSPCQGFSFAGKQLNFEDPRSKLFFEFVRLLEEIRVINPGANFLLENVKMKKEYQDAVSGLLGVEPIEINSALLSGQKRQRLYWTNIPNIHQPVDRNISVGDVTGAKRIPDNIELLLANKSVNTKQNFSPESSTLKRMVKNLVSPNDKAKCLTASMWKGMSANGMTNIYDGEIVRQITPIECERLQTVPDGYTDCVSNTQRYKMLGNGWTVDVIAHILKNL